MLPQPDFKDFEIHAYISNDDNNTSTLYLHYLEAGQVRVMNRPAKESVSRTLTRFQRNLIKATSTKKKKKHGILDNKHDQSHVRLIQGDVELDIDSISNEELNTGMVLYIDKKHYKFVIDAPIIQSISTYPKKDCFIHVPIVPTITSISCDGIDYMWCSKNRQTLHDYTICSTSAIFIPTEAHIDHELKLYCTPWKYTTLSTTTTTATTNEATINALNSNSDSHTDMNSSTIKNIDKMYGRTVTCYLGGYISNQFPHAKMNDIRKILNAYQPYHQPNDGMKYIENTNTNDRYENVSIEKNLMNNEASNEFMTVTTNQMLIREHNNLRIISFNLLAEYFATKESSLKYYYPYCKVKYLQTEYRVPLIIQELLSYQADIICLQECDAKIFKAYYFPLFSTLQYIGHYTNKLSNVPEGCGIFLNTQKFTLLQVIETPLKRLLPHLPELQTFYTYHPYTKKVICSDLGNIGQIAIVALIDDPSHIVIIGNTHLYYHAKADYIRLLQTYACISLMEDIRQQIMTQQSTRNIAIVSTQNDKEIQTSISTISSIDNNIPSRNHYVSESYINRYNWTLNLPYSDIIDKRCTTTPCTTSTTSLSPSSTTNTTTTTTTTTAYSNHPVTQVSCIFAGDLNSTADSAAIEFLTKGIIESDHPIWDTAADFYNYRRSKLNTTFNNTPSKKYTRTVKVESNTNKSGNTGNNTSINYNNNNNGNSSSSVGVSVGAGVESTSTVTAENGEVGEDVIDTPTELTILDQSMKNLSLEKNGLEKQHVFPELRHSMQLSSAGGYPTYTNYTKGFKDLLDWIFIESNNMNTIRIGDYPSEDILSEQVALPSQYFPSDHIAIAVDVQILSSSSSSFKK